MAITNYAELKTAIAGFLHRADLTDNIPDFITIAENALMRRLRLRCMENIATGTVSSSVALPTGFLEVIAITVNSGGYTYPLSYANPQYVTSEAGSAEAYTLIGDNIYFLPTGAGETYSLTYYAKLESVATSDNWLITNAPEVYLYASMIEACEYIEDLNKIQLWQAKLDGVIQELMASDRKDRFGSNLLVRVA